MLTFSEFIKRTDRKDITGYRLDDIVSECYKQNEKRIGNLLSDEFKNIIWSSASISEYRKTHDDAEYISESYFKTYPSKALAKCIAKSIFRKYNTTVHIVGTDKQTICICQNGQVQDSSEQLVDDANLILIRMHERDSDNDIPGIVNFTVYVDRAICRNYDADLVKLFMNDGLYCGYDYVSHNFDGSESEYAVYDIAFEARHKKSRITIDRFLYHIAPLSVKAKIIKYGLVPKSKSVNRGVKMNHPDSVYMFTKLLDDMTLCKFMTCTGKKSYSYSANILSKDNSYVLFQIDLTKFKDISLFSDPMFKTKREDPIAVYTYSNIPPNAISVHHEIRQFQD